jgi:hypothetical protein
MNSLSDADLFELLEETRADLSHSLYQLEDLAYGEPMVDLCRNEIDIFYNTLIEITKELCNRGYRIGVPKSDHHRRLAEKSLAKHAELGLQSSNSGR